MDPHKVKHSSHGLFDAIKQGGAALLSGEGGGGGGGGASG